MIKRTIEQKLIELASYFPVISLNGPRQSGKTTLIKKVFPELPYISLEDPDQRLLATEDPRGFLQNFPQGAVFDEAQRVPVLFSYIQGIVDSNPEIRFILSGSQNFLMSEKITQSLAGRVGLLTLLPFSYDEIKNDNSALSVMEDQIYKGFYPRIYDKDIPPDIYYSNYLSTYVERDVRLITNIGDLNQFILFIKLCAGRVGQLVNYSSLGNDAGISVGTVKSWISILEMSYILYKLYPHHQNFNKRLTKSPKLYFYDTGLLCYLLEIAGPEQFSTHYNRGGIFESFVISEVKKYYQNRMKREYLSFWQNNMKKEVDLIIEDEETKAVEIKSAKTYNPGFVENLQYWQKLSGAAKENLFVIYGGDNNWKMKNGNLIPWNQISGILG